MSASAKKSFLFNNKPGPERERESKKKKCGKEGGE
jgi:hypothetical protein